jgi:hypothetical protein
MSPRAYTMVGLLIVGLSVCASTVCGGLILWLIR